MFQKNHKSSTELGVSRLKSARVRCSACSAVSQAADIYFTGRNVCEKCKQRSGESMATRPDGGDFIDRSLPPTPSKPKTVVSSHRGAALTDTRADLASGDHYERKKSKRKSKSDTKVQKVDKTKVKTKYTCLENIQVNDDADIKVEYQNTNYTEDYSSCSSLSSTSSVLVKNTDTLPKNCQVCPRPVTCPIQECSKMVATDSVMLHFYFDHSKVPRKNLVAGTPNETVVYASDIGYNTQCLHVFLLQDNTGTQPKSIIPGAILSEKFSDHNAIFLMGARMQTKKPLSSASTQTDLVYNYTARKNVQLLAQTKVNISGNEKDTDAFEDGEMMLLWLCKLENNKSIYSITLVKDKVRGYSYIGEAVSIREQLTAANMFERSDCLIVHAAALNKLLDHNNQLSIYVNFLD